MGNYPQFCGRMDVKKKTETIALNRRAGYEYAFLDKFTAGIQLTGTEIKSVRAREVNLSDGFCAFQNGELFLINVHIAEYVEGSYNNHLPKRDRKLLLTKTELRKMSNKLKDKGLTIVPISLFIAESGYAKVEIAVAKGKKTYDKRESIKERDVKRNMERD